LPGATADHTFRYERRWPGHQKGEPDDRTPAQRDRDRLLYSSSFRRLAEVTQVISPTVGYVFHNRLTHSLQVAQVGRRLAERLLKRYPDIAASQDINPDIVEAACLAHDLGHPPFGHIAEEELNSISNDFGGFNGNAQSFRILTKLAFQSKNHRGLNLTRATLAGVLKYPWRQGEHTHVPGEDKWGAYETENEDFQFATALTAGNQERTIEADLMDWADDITYSVHDIEDFYRARRIPLHLLGDPPYTSEREMFFENVFERRKFDDDFARPYHKDLTERFTNVILTFPLDDVYIGTAAQRASLRTFTSNLIGRYINGTALHISNNVCRVEINPVLRAEVAMLKELVWTYVIEAPALATQQYGQRSIIRKLFKILIDAAEKPAKRQIFPAYYRERLEDAGQNTAGVNRTCVDLIASLTENQVINIYHRLAGVSLGLPLEDLII
jgi:dGTPase